MREIKLSSLLEKFCKVSLNKRLDQSGAPRSAASPLKKRKGVMRIQQKKKKMEVFSSKTSPRVTQSSMRKKSLPPIHKLSLLTPEGENVSARV